MELKLPVKLHVLSGFLILAYCVLPAPGTKHQALSEPRNALAA